MKLTFTDTELLVEREEGDPKYYGAKDAKAESNFLYHIKTQLNEEHGFDLIKKRMWKDGHLVDELQQYLRTRKPTGDPAKDVAILNPMWATYDAGIEFTEDGWYRFRVIRNLFNTDEEG